MKLSKKKFEKVSDFIQKNARELDKKYFDYYFKDGSTENVVNALEDFQNEDGGFGHGLEPDSQNPNSGNLATTLALQYLQKVKVNPENEILKKTINYFSKNFSEKYGMWRSMPEDVNDYPHAPWWHWDKEKDVIGYGESWENPSVEILGYLHKYVNDFPKDKLDSLTDKAINILLRYKEKVDEHNLFCYQTFYVNVDNKIKFKIHDKLSELIQNTVNHDIEDWKTKYVPKPLDFIQSPDSSFAKLFPELIDANIDLLIQSLDKEDAWFPVWSWNGNYEEVWKKARIDWAGKKSVENLIVLDKFSRIEK